MTLDTNGNKLDFDFRTIAESHGFGTKDSQNECETLDLDSKLEAMYDAIASQVSKLLVVPLGDQLFLVLTAIPNPSKGNKIAISLRMDWTDIAEMIWIGHGNSWHLTHRETSEKYGDNGIGSLLLDMSEKMIDKFSGEPTKRSQICDTAQIDVWSWLAKNGYKVASDEADLFHTVMSELSVNSGKYKINESGYVYDINTKKNFRFKFIKEVTPEKSIEGNAPAIKQVALTSEAVQTSATRL